MFIILLKTSHFQFMRIFHYMLTIQFLNSAVTLNRKISVSSNSLPMSKQVPWKGETEVKVKKNVIQCKNAKVYQRPFICTMAEPKRSVNNLNVRTRWQQEVPQRTFGFLGSLKNPQKKDSSKNQFVTYSIQAFGSSENFRDSPTEAK